MKRHLNYKHGLTGTHFMMVWSDILRRCNNPNRQNYKYYGGRGIKCEWKSFEGFRNDMYKSYLRHIKKYNTTTIERKNNDGNYCKTNCKWITLPQQAKNKTTNRLIKFQGKTMILKDWSKKLNIKYTTLLRRIDALHWPIKKAFETPIDLRKSHPRNNFSL